MKTQTQVVYLTVRCKVFAGEGAREYKFRVEGDDLAVFDSVAGHYTTCHSMTARTMGRVIRTSRE